MKLQIYRHGLYIAGCPEEMSNGLDRVKAAYAAGILPEGRKVFSAKYAPFYAVINGDVLRFYFHRDDRTGVWNMEAYSLPSFELIGGYGHG